MATLARENVIQVRFPQWHVGQRQILDSTARYRVAACGRRFGKSYLAQYRIARPALDGKPTAYMCDGYKLLSDTWREVTKRLGGAIKRASENERRMELITGGSIDFWTLGDQHAGRSRKYAHVVIDEAGLVPDLGAIWEAAIRPTLTDLRGSADFYGTPLGRNYFWQVFQRGSDPADAEWQSWQMPSSANPHLPAGEIEEARKTMTERRYRQEYLAEFLEDGGGVFRFVREAAVATPQDQAADGHAYAIGCDWGRSGDFSVFAVLDCTERAIVHLDRMTGVEYAHQRLRLRALWERFNRPLILAESNAIGGPVVEELRREGLPVQPFVTTNASKAQLIDALALALERREVRVVPDPVLVAELESYESERLPSGAIRYGAPEGQHDDCVIATCLAWWAGAPSQLAMMV